MSVVGGRSASLQSAFNQGVSRAPAALIARVLQPKLKSAGIRRYKQAAMALAEHLLSGSGETFKWGTGDAGARISIDFDDEDYAELERLQKRLADTMPDLIERLAKEVAHSMIARYTAEWKQSRYREERFYRAFRDGIEEVWGEGLDLLRVLLDVSRQIGESAHERATLSRAKKGHFLSEALIRLHIRACQIAAEIMVLLENGFPDGALGRWRTLHEIATVALVLQDGGDELAERYLAHHDVENKKAFDRFLIDREHLGYKAPSATETKRIDRAFGAVVKKYGSSFKTEYGWAAAYLGKDRPRFIDLQDASGRAPMHSMYKMASYNVHATSKALYFRIGSLDEPDLLLAGATNAGLEEPGQNLAVTLTIISSLLLRRNRYALDDLAFMLVLMVLRDQAVEALLEADKSLRRQEREIQRAVAEFEQ